MVERAIGELEPPASRRSGPWQEQLKDGLREMRAAVRPRTATLHGRSFARIPLGENALRASEWMIAHAARAASCRTR